jgi:hypothetical protein
MRTKCLAPNAKVTLGTAEITVHPYPFNSQQPHIEKFGPIEHYVCRINDTENHVHEIGYVMCSVLEAARELAINPPVVR